MNMEAARSVRIRYRLWHLFAIVACVAIFVTFNNALVKSSSRTCGTVEITNYNSADASLGYIINAESGGVAASRIWISNADPSINYAKLVGEKYPLRFRPSRVLWLGPEDPVPIARRLVEAELSRAVERRTD